jgi:transcriptional regulator with XRE-family HTH domain
MAIDEKAFLVAIGQQIRKARTANNMTQEELASSIGKSQNVISEYENGLKAMHVTSLLEVTEALGVSLPYMFGIVDEDPEIFLLGKVYDLEKLSKESLKKWIEWQLRYHEKIAMLLRDQIKNWEYLAQHKNPLTETVEMKDVEIMSRQIYGEKNLVNITMLMDLILEKDSTTVFNHKFTDEVDNE